MLSVGNIFKFLLNKGVAGMVTSPYGVGVKTTPTILTPEDGVMQTREFQTIGFDSSEQANAFMEGNADWGMIAEKGGKILLAKLTDKGTPIAKEAE
jgi:hypothetical protein